MALTLKQEMFINAYLVCRNATEAARRAGYSRKTARQMGTENLSKPSISEAIRARVAEAEADADEVVRRLVDHSRGSMGEFLSFDKRGDVAFDLASAPDKLHLIKKFKKTVKTFGEDGSEVTYELELYDAQAALDKLGRYFRMWSDKDDEAELRRALKGLGLNYDDAVNRLSDEFQELIRAGAAGADASGGDAGEGAA